MHPANEEVFMIVLGKAHFANNLSIICKEFERWTFHNKSQSVSTVIGS